MDKKHLDGLSKPQPVDGDPENSTSGEEEETDSEGLTINAVLLPSDNKNAYRFQPTEAYQRTTASDRLAGAVRIQYKIVEVVHGTLFPDDQKPNATLIVFQCTFSSKRQSRRAASVDVEFVFKGHGPGDPYPEVYDMAPKHKTCLVPESLHETVTRGASAGVNVPLFGGVGAEGSTTWQATGVRIKTNYATVTGESALYEKDTGGDNGAAWTLTENPDSHGGVPRFFQGAIMLKRADATSHFQCDVKITARMDWRTNLSSLFRSIPLDKPILFDPRLPSTNKFRTYTTSQLNDVKVEDFEEITFMKIKSGVSQAG